MAFRESFANFAQNLAKNFPLYVTDTLHKTPHHSHAASRLRPR